MDLEAMPIVCMGSATRVFSYGIIRAVNFGQNARFVMFDLQYINGKYCRVPNLVLDVPVDCVAQAIKMAEAAMKHGGIVQADNRDNYISH